MIVNQNLRKSADQELEECFYLNCSWTDSLKTALLVIPSSRFPLTTFPINRTTFTKLITKPVSSSLTRASSPSFLPACRRRMPLVPVPFAMALSGAVDAEHNGNVRAIEEQY